MEIKSIHDYVPPIQYIMMAPAPVSELFFVFSNFSYVTAAALSAVGCHKRMVNRDVTTLSTTSGWSRRLTKKRVSFEEGKGAEKSILIYISWLQLL